MNAAKVVEELKQRFPNEPEYIQAVSQVLPTIEEEYNKHPEFEKANLIERLCIPDRVCEFRITWVDDKGNVQTNMGYRIQHNNAIGPYKGGLRYHKSVNLGILKFLAFEQTFKNSLTTLPMGGAKGGSDFSPRGKSDAEVMRFCQAFMNELYRVIGPDEDVPAGDIGVGGREVGYLFGQYKKLTVAQYATEKCIQLGAIPLTLSDSDGYIYDPDGIDEAKLAYVKELKNVERGRIKEYVEEYPNAVYHAGERPWHEKADIALPCATQNEINAEQAQALVDNGVIAVAEGANMPTLPEAIKIFQDAKLLYSPGKASNAGGVSVSGLEMSQNSERLSWTSKEVDDYLKRIMNDIHENCVKYGTEADGYINYVKGANVAGFMKVANAMMAQGIV